MNLTIHRLKRTIAGPHLHYKEGGQAAIEFAVIVPLVLLLVAAVVELTSMFVETEKITNISRELAKTVYYECAGRTDTSISQCVEANMQDVLAQTNKILGNFERQGRLIVALYQPSPTGGTPSQIIKETAALSGAALSTKFDSTTVGTVTGLTVTNEAKGVVVIGEIYYQFVPKTPLGAALKSLFPDYYYEAAIF